MNSYLTDLIDLACLAYPSRRVEVPEPDCWRCEYFDYKDVQGVYAWNREIRQRVLAVAGTNEPNDYWTDKDISPRPLRHMGASVYVHQGFLKHASQLDDFLDDSGIMQDWSEWETTLVGHSLGAPVCGILPMLCPDLRVDSIRAFASPRWLRSDTAEHYSLCGKTHRYSRPMDIVCDVPLNVGFRFVHCTVGGWSHCGDHTWINNDGTFAKERSSSWDLLRHAYRTVTYWKTLPWNWGKRASRDHDVVLEYRRLIHENARLAREAASHE